MRCARDTQHNEHQKIKTKIRQPAYKARLQLHNFSLERLQQQKEYLYRRTELWLPGRYGRRTYILYRHRTLLQTVQERD